ncbi:MAG: DUF928 domain-containing protein [Spirulinaceae cyanobacterium SM2_1_0]|nr:DUF928 domain-containing protein [Spirulinaceae cyanobacterium SM2_1_0]
MNKGKWIMGVLLGGAIAIASGVQAQPLQAISPEDLVLQLQRDKKPGGSRDSVFNRACAIAPRLLTEDDASEQVWSLQPLFLWQLESATVARINLYLLEADEQPIWSYEPAPDATQLAYDGEPLVPGQKYGWEVIVAANDPAPGQLNLSSGDDYGSFLVMATSERERIERDLVALEARLKAAAASPEAMALERAHYFAAQSLWSDALGELYAVTDPSPELLAAREQLQALNFCAIGR